METTTVAGLEHELTFQDETTFQLNITVPWTVIDEKMNAIASDLRKALVVPGYRPGRAPVMLIRTMFHKAIESEIEKWIPELVQQVVKEEDLDLLGDVQILQWNLMEETPLVIETRGRVWPKIELKPMDKVRAPAVKKELEQVAEQVIEEEIQRLIEKAAVLQPIEDRPARKDDVVRVRLIVTDRESGRTLTVAETGEEVTLRLDNPLVHPAVVNHLVDHERGEEVTWEMDVLYYPDNDDGDQELFQYRRWQFRAHIEGVYRADIPPRDEIMEQEGYESEEEWREVLSERLAPQIRQRQRRHEREALLDAMVAKEPDLPRYLLRSALRAVIREQFEKGLTAFEQAFYQLGHLEKLHETALPEARQRLTRELVVHHVARQHQIEVTEEDIDRYLEEIAQERSVPVAYLRAQIQRMPEEQENVRDAVLDRKVIAFLKENVGKRAEKKTEKTAGAGAKKRKKGGTKPAEEKK